VVLVLGGRLLGRGCPAQDEYKDLEEEEEVEQQQQNCYYKGIQIHIQVL
jgi:hypothetical protein